MGNQDINEAGQLELSKNEPRLIILSASNTKRLVISLIMTILPIVSFILAGTGFLDPEWQSGQLSDYALILLGGI